MVDRPSRRTLRALALFGLTLDQDAGRHLRLAQDSWPRAAAEIDARLLPAQIALITGPSGAGKSTLLRLLEERLRERGLPTHRLHPCPRAGRRTLIDLVPGTLEGPDGALRRLASAGLADATLLARTPAQLSDGQRFRLALARAMAIATPGSRRFPSTGGADGPPPTLLIDEFCATLDRLTARSVARTLRRWLDRSTRAHPPGARVAIATSHDDLATALRPDLLVRVSMTGLVEIDHP